MSRPLLLALLPVVALAQSVVYSGGASVDTSGLCGVSMSCEVASLTSAGTITSQASSGQSAFEVTTYGARIRMGPGNNQWWQCPDSAKCATDSLLWLGGGVNMYNGQIGDTFRGAVTINASAGLLVTPTTLIACASSLNLGASATPRRAIPGVLLAVTGGAGKPTRLCYCTHDGTNYKWFNLLVPTDSSGTATTCPDYP